MTNFEVHSMQAQLTSAAATLTGLLGALEVINATLSAIGALLFIGVTVLTLKKMLKDGANQSPAKNNRE
jgi:midasin (ATPase involved in ribosome maturation)